MRRALNENPMVQIGVLGLGALLLVVLYFTMIRDSTGAGEATPPVTEAPAPTATADPVAPPPATPASPPASVAGEVEPGKGLPRPVVRAYRDGKAIALLVVADGGISDRAVKRYVEALDGRGDTRVFVADADEIADYSRITQGVSVSRTPALVVVRPRAVSDGVPVATVSHGFRGVQSVEQALDDALYDGPTRGYDPG